MLVGGKEMGGQGKYVPIVSLVGFCELELNSVDAINAVYEEDQYEYEGYLHPILYFRY